MKSMLLIIPISLALILLGCDFCVNDRPYWHSNPDGCCDYNPPPVPTGVHSVTGDNEVYIYWTPVRTSDFDGYEIYRGDGPTGYYEHIGSSSSACFTDRFATNGITYYYAISSVDYSGNESELSFDLVYDTPRPEGYSYHLWSAEEYPSDAGYDFSERLVVPWDYPTCDFYFGHDALGYYLCAANDYTDLMDWGPAWSLSDVDVAPEEGWSAYADIEAVAGHAYIFWTADNHFATVLIRSISGERLTFDWAYQLAPGNPELKVIVEKPTDRTSRVVRRTIPAS